MKHNLKIEQVKCDCRKFQFCYFGASNLGRNWHTVIHETTKKVFHVHSRRDRLPAICLGLFAKIRQGIIPDQTIEAL